MDNKILIIDDEPNNLNILRKCLCNANFKVFVAKDGEAALKRLNHIKPDLILLDVMMPGIDGFETCRQLKKNELTKEIPVIFVTAKAEAIDKVKGLEIGAVDYITKPFQVEEVIARVNKHLTINNLHKQLETQNTQLQEHVYRLESLATLGKAINEAPGMVKMMDNAMQVTLSTFKCDRAWLVYPCDPTSVNCQIRIETTTPEYPGVKTLNEDIPISPEVAKVMKKVLSTTEAIPFGVKHKYQLPATSRKQFSVQAAMVIAIYPKIGKPWLFGLHQCSYARKWTENELNLFQDFGRHISESLGAFFSFEELKKSENQFRSYFESASMGFAITSLEKSWLYANNCVCNILG
ncbi:MAG: response regulator, partial [Proteobacteria bacterium]|nr:response regulator [Pseudomonadota bacterium]